MTSLGECGDRHGDFPVNSLLGTSRPRVSVYERVYAQSWRETSGAGIEEVKRSDVIMAPRKRGRTSIGDGPAWIRTRDQRIMSPLL
jgi:hypothetical protein